MSIEERIRSVFPEEEEIPEAFRIRKPVVQKEYLIDGKLRNWKGKTHKVLSPIYIRKSKGLTQAVIGEYPLLTRKEALAALDAAIHAYSNGRGIWPAMPVRERLMHVEKFTALLQGKKNEIIRLLMWEIGKSCRESKKEFDRTVDYLKSTIEAVKDLDRDSSKFVIEQGIIGQIRRSPLGVALCMGPFNFPLNETFATLIPALLMGNTVIFKPPKLGVLLHYPLLKAFKETFPPGVVNTVYGEGRSVIKPILSSGKIDILAFIGSGKTADVLKGYHPKPQRLRSVLGLEAKNAAIVLSDADIDQSVSECVQGSLSFNGQRCTALKILFVHTNIADIFLQKFCNAVEKLKFGMPWEKDVTITPLPESGKAKRLGELIKDAQGHGAKIINRSGGMTNKTVFYPAVLYPVSTKMKIYHEEQFGPLVPVVPFDDVEIPVRHIIESSYGQQASIFGNDPDTISRLVDILVNQICRVNINSMCQRGPDILPFAGRKDSGEGTLSVSDALRVFSIRTIVAARERGGEMLRQIVKKRTSKFHKKHQIY
jgi:glyceraldehyde-3-phosphate dehydrogenase (NADP+)